MAKKRNRKLLLVLAMSALLTFCGCTENDSVVEETAAVAVEENAPRSDFRTELVEENTVRIIGYLGEGPVVEVPETVLGLTVVSIGSEAFAQPGIEEIILPDTVTALEAYAFKDCSDLRSITFGSGLKRVGNYAFQGCPNLEKVIFPDSVMAIGCDLFGENETITEVNIPADVMEMFGTIASVNECPNLVVTVTAETLGYYSAASASLPVNILPNTSGTVITPVDEIAHENSEKEVLETIDDPDEDPVDTDTFVSKKDTTEESLFEVEPIGANTCAVIGCSSESDVIVVPDTIQGMTVIRIASRAFENSSAVAISIPDTVTYIESYAFSKCKKLETIELSRFLEKVGELVFNECPSLEKILFPGGMTEFEGTPIGRCASLQLVYIPDSVTIIPDGIVSTSLCPNVVIVTPSGSAAEAVALDAGIPVNNEVSGG